MSEYYMRFQDTKQRDTGPMNWQNKGEKRCQNNKDITVLSLWQVKCTIKHTVWELIVWERKVPKRGRHKI